MGDYKYELIIMTFVHNVQMALVYGGLVGFFFHRRFACK